MTVNAACHCSACCGMCVRWPKYSTPRLTARRIPVLRVCAMFERLTEFCFIFRFGFRENLLDFTSRMERLRVCKVSLCENCQRQRCKAFIGLTIRAIMIGGVDPLYLKFWIKLIALERNRRFSISFRSYSDSAVIHSEKSSINTNPLPAVQWGQDEHRTLSLSPLAPKKG